MKFKLKRFMCTFSKLNFFQYLLCLTDYDQVMHVRKMQNKIIFFLADNRKQKRKRGIINSIYSEASLSGGSQKMTESVNSTNTYGTS